jgi:hypothetical protein
MCASATSHHPVLNAEIALPNRCLFMSAKICRIFPSLPPPSATLADVSIPALFVNA